MEFTVLATAEMQGQIRSLMAQRKRRPRLADYQEQLPLAVCG